MLEFQEKRKIKSFLSSKITLVVLIIVIGFFFNAVWNLYQKQDITKDNLSKSAAIYENLRSREKMLSLEVEKLKTTEGKEEEIREKYGLVKPGEEVIVVVDKDESAQNISVHSENSFWDKVKSWFK